MHKQKLIGTNPNVNRIVLARFNTRCHILPTIAIMRGDGRFPATLTFFWLLYAIAIGLGRRIGP